MFLINADLILNLQYTVKILMNHVYNVCMLFTFGPANFNKCLTDNAYMWSVNKQISAQHRALKEQISNIYNGC